MLSLNKSYKNRKVSLTIYCKYKYFDSTVQRAEDRRQKFYFCGLPFVVNVKLTSLMISLALLRDDYNGFFQVNLGTENKIREMEKKKSLLIIFTVLSNVHGSLR